MKLTIETIPHDQQRYPTCGDWIVAGTKSKPEITIYVSDLKDWRMELAIGIHEAVETALCIEQGIFEESVNAFDIAYEAAREAGTKAPCGCAPTDESEPGDDPHAPYATQHCLATSVERLIIATLGLSWADYEKKVLALG